MTHEAFNEPKCQISDKLLLVGAGLPFTARLMTGVFLMPPAASS